MIRRVRAPFVLALAFLALLAVPFVAGAQPAKPEPVTMEWFGWSHYRFTSPNGTVVLTNPFTANPDSPIKASDITKADLIFAADGHADEVGSTVELAQATGAMVIAPSELSTWMIEQGVPRAQVAQFIAPGDRLRVKGVTARVVESFHGSGLSKPSPTTPYGGVAGGVVLTFENGFTVYFAGSAPAMSEQALWAEMYKPHLAILHMGARHEPLDFAMQVKLLRTYNPNLRTVMPHHHRVVQTAGTTNVQEVRDAIGDMGVGRIELVAPQLGVKYSLVP
ncbi:MAG TPA: MBL fold metallo-hydrolase [Chloroflexota bacterium]|jgi:L-ascorbate metabolism protein UlaG (beta-lactamase superfamily)|nr:MBL fold metallo-hydrolase [Chloroflexota bacterium]